MSRLTTAVRVTALLRRVAAEGGFAAVLAKGDETAGAVLVLALDCGAGGRLLERGLGPKGEPMMIAVGPDGPDAIGDYWARRRRTDPDLWVVELDHPEAARITAEVLD